MTMPLHSLDYLPSPRGAASERPPPADPAPDALPPQDGIQAAIACLDQADQCLRRGDPSGPKEVLQLLEAAAAHLRGTVLARD